MLESRHQDNPTLWDPRRGAWTPAGRSYIARLDALTGPRKDRLRFGRWVQAEGVVYDDWDRDKHLVDRFTIPGDWRRIRAIDFGHTHPFVCLWIAVDGDGRMYVYRELYHTRRTVRAHAERILALSASETFEFTVADHDAEDRATLLESGIATIAARKEVNPGIEAVQERLKPAGDGRPRLVVLRDSLVERDSLLVEAKRPTSLVEEIDGYVWSRGADGRPSGDAPVKADDHALDALRYATLAIDRKLPPLEPGHVREARERARHEQAERTHRDIFNDFWWTT